MHDKIIMLFYIYKGYVICLEESIEFKCIPRLSVFINLKSVKSYSQYNQPYKITFEEKKDSNINTDPDELFTQLETLTISRLKDITNTIYYSRRNRNATSHYATFDFYQEDL